MTALTPIITAQVITLAPLMTSGKGFVEKITDDGRAVIAAGSGKMIARLTSGTLTQGDTVLFQVRGRELYIEKIDTSAPPAPCAPSLTSAFASADAFEALPRTAPASATPTSFPMEYRAGTEPVEGYYYFSSIAGALKWAFSAGAKVDEDTIRRFDILFDNKPVVVYVGPDESPGRRLTFMSIESANTEMLHFVRTGLSNSFWDSISPGALMLLLTQRGSLSRQRLLDIDNALPDTGDSAPFPIQSAGMAPSPGALSAASFSKDALEAISVQWLNIACEPATPLSAVSAPPAASGSAEFPEWFENAVSPGSSGSAFFSGIDLRDFTMNSGAAALGEPMERIVPRLFTGLGLDFEHSLAQSTSDTAPAAPPPSLKLLLLKALGESGGAIGMETAASVENARKEMIRAINRLLTEAEGQIGKLNAELPVALQTLRREISQRLDGFGAQTQSLVMKALSEPVNAHAANLLKSTEGAMPPAVDSSNEPLHAQSGTTDAAVKTEMLVRASLQRMLQSVETVVDGIVFRFQSVFTRAAGSAEGEAPDRTFSRARRDDLDSLIKELTSSIEHATRDIPRRIDRILFEATRLSESPAANGPAAHDVHTSDGQRQHIESMLQRFESLQILAKPVSTTQGEQQVMLLPMKIDGRWNDVVVKFVKDRHAGKKNTRQNVMVELHVSPAMLGPIDVKMDYTMNRDLTVRMYFDKDRTRDWFEQNREALRGAIQKLGFKTLRMTMQKNIQRSRDSAASPAPPNGKSAIDIVA